MEVEGESNCGKGRMGQKPENYTNIMNTLHKFKFLIITKNSKQTLLQVLQVNSSMDDSGVPKVGRRVEVVRIAIEMCSAEVHCNWHLFNIEFATFYSSTENLKIVEYLNELKKC